MDNVVVPAASFDFDAVENAPEPEKICLEYWGH